MNIVTDAPETVVEWAAEKLRTTFVKPYVAWGIENKDSRLIGAVIFNDYTGPNIEVTIVGHGAFTRNVLKRIAAYCFGEMKCDRLSCHTRAANAYVNKYTSHCGWVPEGRRRKFFGDDDAITWGMLQNECKWL